MNDPNLPLIRKANLVLLLKKYQNQREFAEAAGVLQPSVSQVLADKRKLGEALARRIERNLGLPSVWMDRPHTGDNPVETLISLVKPSLTRLIEPTPVRMPTIEERRQRDAEHEEQEDAVLAELHSTLLSVGVTPDDIEDRARTFTPLGLVKTDFAVHSRDGQTLLDVVRLPTYRGIVSTQGGEPRGHLGLDTERMLDRLLAKGAKLRSASRPARYGVVLWSLDDINVESGRWKEDAIPRLASAMSAAEAYGYIQGYAVSIIRPVEGLPTMFDLCRKLYS